MDGLAHRFGRLVAANRKRREWTQADLAERAAISKHMVAKLEVGLATPRFGTIEKIAAALEVDPAELFTTELSGGVRQRAALNELVSKLSGLPDRKLVWLSRVIDEALKTS